jgi:hypothetical protein
VTLRRQSYRMEGSSTRPPHRTYPRTSAHHCLILRAMAQRGIARGAAANSTRLALGASPCPHCWSSAQVGLYRLAFRIASRTSMASSFTIQFSMTPPWYIPATAHYSLAPTTVLSILALFLGLA